MKPTRLTRPAAAVFIAAYLAAIAFYFYPHVLGDSAKRRDAYFWTWDMYPGYDAESVRRLVVAETDEGRYVRLFPSPRHRFRWGLNGDKTRLDLDRRTTHLRRVVEDELSRGRRLDTEERVTRVYAVEQYWPVRFNLDDDLYRAVYDEPNPRNRYWRVIGEADVDGDRQVQWKPVR